LAERALVAALAAGERGDLADEGVVAGLDNDAVALAGDNEGRVEDLYIASVRAI
jgi:hypothetical protein